MIQEIPYKYDPAYKKDKKPEMSDYLLHLSLIHIWYVTMAMTAM